MIIMLGEQIAVEKIKMVSRRVLSVKDGVPKIETATTGTGNYRGTEYQQTSTFWTVPKSLDGKTMYIEGQGVITTKDGEMATILVKRSENKLEREETQYVSMDHYSTKPPVMVVNCLHYQIL
jgi:hypothetical protein